MLRTNNFDRIVVALEEERVVRRLLPEVVEWPSYALSAVRFRCRTRCEGVVTKKETTGKKAAVGANSATIMYGLTYLVRL